MTVAEVIALLAGHGLLVDGSVPSDDVLAAPVTGLACDSRVVRPGNAFVCKGAAFRESFLADAARAGAVVALAETGLAESFVTGRLACDIPVIVVRDARLAMAVVAPPAWGRPADELRVSGITGTKGKTTASFMLRSMLDAEAGRQGATALFGSVETYDGVERLASVNTTPEAPDLWRHLANAREAGLHDVVMEVSSQALKYHRVDGLPLEAAAFLNLGRDHISPVEHPTFDDYKASKLRIFDQARVAVVNAAGDHMDEALAAARVRCERVLTFSAAGDAAADVYATDVRPAAPTGGARGATGTTFVAHMPDGVMEARVALPGAFNVENALAAIAMADQLGVGRDATVAGLARARVPGRMEVIDDAADLGIVGVVDFAHNALALSRLLPAVRDAWPDAALVAVFGATGGKGVERRREMAAEATRWVDHLVFTEDDPGEEEVADICAAMVDAVAGRVPCEVVPDREEAVRRAVDLARSLDRLAVVCLVGRGTEPTMHRGRDLVPFPLDADILREALRETRR